MSSRPMVLRVLTVMSIAAGVAAAPAAASAGPMLWVSSGGTDSGYCSQANPCATVSRAVSLAIPTGTIVVGPGRYTDHVTIPSSDSPLTIQGAGVGATTVSGGFNGSGSVFTIPSGVNATITDMSIVGGQAANGGGVNDAGNLTLQRDVIGFNAATGTGANGLGGGVYASQVPALSISDSQIVSNQASNAGGGIYAAGTGNPSTVTRDLINSNSVLNSSGSGGGALALGAGDWTDDTIAGNQIVDANSNPQGYGGGLWAGLSYLHSDTIVGNTGAAGGGLLSYSAGVAGTIIAGNHGANCGGAVGDGGDNLEDDAGGVCGFRPPLGDRIGVDPMLGPLADNGGPTKTMAISGSSPAYGASQECTGTDQRGVSRLQRGATTCDIGAYQVEAPTTYVANPSGGSVTAYATGANGDAAPVLRLSGPATGLNQPTGVVADDAGDVFVANAGNDSVTEYAPEVTGNSAPTVTISGAQTGLSRPQDVAVGPNGRLYVTNLNGSVTSYAAGASGNVAPVTTISGQNTRLAHPHGLVFDPSGQLRVTTALGTVNTYDPQADGNVEPNARLKMGRDTDPEGFNFDPAGNVVVADDAGRRVLTYAGKNPTPIRTLTPAPSGFTKPIGLDLDLPGDLFVADSGSDTVAEFPPAASGAATPLAVISGPDTGLSAPAFLSELPPPPVPGVRLAVQRRQPRSRVLGRGIAIGGSAFGRLAFRDRPVTIAAVARVRGRIIARAKVRALRPGKIKLLLLTTKDAARIIRARRPPATITVTVTVRGGAGTQNRRLTISCTR
jgi:sugar lactone lactonase YvrE